MLSLSKLATKSVSTTVLSRSYSKIRELSATVPGKMPQVCSPEEVVGCIKSGDRVWVHLGPCSPLGLLNAVCKVGNPAPVLRV